VSASSPRTRVSDSIRAFQNALHDERLLATTIDLLYDAGEVSKERAEGLRAVLSDLTATTSYIIRHLAVHLGIGASKMIVPLPIGAFLRGAWVAFARAVETLRRRPEQARVHSLPVFLVACVPFFGYLAYIVALRRHDPDAAFLYANHLSYLRYDLPLEAVLRDRPRLIQRIVRRAVGTTTPEARRGA